MITENDIGILSKTLKFWNHLTQNEKSLLINNVSRTKYSRGENIHDGENDCIGVLILISGSLRTYMLSEEGKEITLYRLHNRDVCILSATCVLKNITFDVHIEAETDCEIWLINPSVFEQLSKQNVYVELFSYKLATDRFSDVMWAMQQILFMSFDKRLAVFLIDEISKTGGSTIYLTHEQIAKYIGSAREVVSRMLKYFAGEGIVELSRGHVKILDKTRLRDLA